MKSKLALALTFIALSLSSDSLAALPRVLPSVIVPTEESVQTSPSAGKPTTGEFDTKEGLTINETLLVDGLVRKTIVHLPKHYKADQRLPLVIVLHGARLSGWMAQAVTGFDKLANDENFIVTYPDAINQQWNDGRKAGDTPSSKVDDVTFLATLIDYMTWKYQADPERIYVAGYSSGGMLAQKMAMERTGKIAALAEVAASLPIPQLERGLTPSKPISILMINGTADRAFPWNGGNTRIIRIKVGEVAPILTTFNYWVNVNGGPGIMPQRQESLDKDPGEAQVSVMNTRTRNSKCVMLYKINGGGHTWPGSEVPLRYIPFLGRQSRQLNASELIWEFFKHNESDCQVP